MKYLSKYADMMHENVRGFFYDCLKTFLNRDELQLSHLGFNDNYNFYKQIIESNFKGNKKLVAQVRMKLKIAYKYQTFLYKTFEKAISKLKQPGLNESEQQYFENFIGMAYFHIPEFRIIFLQEKFVDVRLLSQTNILDFDQIQDKKKQAFISLFDWEKGFYSILILSEKGKKRQEKILQILNQQDFGQSPSKKRFSQQKRFHFHIIQEWATYVKKLSLNQQTLPWEELPGYNLIIGRFKNELTSIELKSFPQFVQDTAKILLFNEQNLGDFVRIIISKTRIHDTLGVFYAFDFTNQWIKVVLAYGKKIPPSFDFVFLFQAIKMVLEGDHALCIAKCLQVVYLNFTQFPSQIIKEICVYLMTEVFFKLFMHWSPIVRYIFQHLLLFRIYHLNKNLSTNIEDLDEIEKRLWILQNKRVEDNFTYEDQKSLVNDYIYLIYVQSMNLIEKKKKILLKEKKQKSKLAKKKNKQDYIREKLSQLKQTKRDLFKKKLKGVNPDQILQKSKEQIIFDEFLVQEKQQNRNLNLKQMKPIKTKIRKIDTEQLKQLDSSGSNKSLNQKNTEKQIVLDLGVNQSDQEIKLPLRKSQFSSNLDDIICKKNINYFMQTPQRFQKNPEQNQKSLQKIESKENKEDKKNWDLKIGKNQKNLVVNRRLQFMDKTIQKNKDIPEEYLKYLLQACNEFETLKNQYSLWYYKVEFLIQKNQNQAYYEQILPDVEIRIPFDTGEISTHENDEW